MTVLLVLQTLSPSSLIEELRAAFDEVIYKPFKPFGFKGQRPPSPEELPTDEEFARTTAILSFVVPPNLTKAEQVPKLQLFQTLSAGYGHITSTEFFKSLPESHSVVFANASGIHVSTIGEHVIATTLSLLHKLHIVEFRTRTDKDWFRAEAAWGSFIRELRDLHVGIIGYGHIGRETARLAAGHGAKILALTRTTNPAPESGYIIPGTGDPDGSLPERYYSTSDKQDTLAFFSACDIVVSTLPDSEATRKFVGEEQLKAMKGDAIFVNIGRGTTVEQEKLVEALKATKAEDEEEGATGTLRIGGASLDVVDPEPLPAGHELYSLENVLLTPHMSALSRSYFIRAADLLRQNIDRLEGGKGAFNAFRGKGERD